MFGHAVMLGIMIHIDNESPIVGRLYDRNGKAVLHWHDAEGDCQERVFSHASTAITVAKSMGISHVFIGTTHDEDDIVPIEQAALMSLLDGQVAIQDAFVSTQRHRLPLS